MKHICIFLFILLNLFLPLTVLSETYVLANHVTFLNIHFKEIRKLAADLKNNSINKKTAITHYATSLAECRKVQTLLSSAIKQQVKLQNTLFLRLMQTHNLLESYIIAQILSSEFDQESSNLSAMLERRLLQILPKFRMPSLK